MIILRIAVFMMLLLIKAVSWYIRQSYMLYVIGFSNNANGKIRYFCIGTTEDAGGGFQ